MVAYLYSVNPQPVVMECGQFGILTIPGVKKGEKHAALEVTDKPVSKDMGEDRYERVVIPAADFAKDLAERYQKNGVSWGETPKPNGDETAEAESVFRQFCEQAVVEADALWRRYNDPRLIEDRARHAVEYLGITKEWHQPGVEPNATKECPKCAEVIKAKAVRCKHCGYEETAAAPPAVVVKTVATGAGANVK